MRFSSSLAFTVLLISLATSSCGSKSEDSAASIASDLPEDFVEFYERFHSDSAYQLQHISFPLEGIKANTDGDSSSTTNWTMEDWTLHRKIQSPEVLTQTFNLLGDDLIVETIEQKDAPIAMQRRYARMAEGWNLIYYVEMQPIRQR